MWIKGHWIKQTFEKICPYCNSAFNTTISYKKYCCNEHLQLDRKYRVGDSLERFIQYMLKAGKGREALSVDILVDMYHQQEGRCALSGVEMTYITGQGRTPTNLSIDRIEAGGPYIKENIRLVCNHVNTMRLDTSDTEFYWWCKRILEYGNVK